MEKYIIKEINNEYYNFYKLAEDESILKMIKNIRDSEFIIEKIDVSEDVERDMKNDINGKYKIQELINQYDYIESYASKYNDVTVSIWGDYNLNRHMIQFCLGSNQAILATPDSSLELSEFVKKVD